ncbi:hypothetical protein JW899_03340 [Candidatus Uhrbacteria bacterium]|nr:hypothetical protein [Candidatus Uhrbacteria bacterium]
MKFSRQNAVTAIAGLAALMGVAVFGVTAVRTVVCQSEAEEILSGIDPIVSEPPQVDLEEYDRRMRRLAHLPEGVSGTGNGAVDGGESGEIQEDPLWPAKAAYPNYGAILPFRRIVAYYGNFYSTGMGVLGEYPEDVMLGMLAREVAAWEEADPDTPVQPAIDYIAVTAQLNPGKDGKYRARMPDSQIERALAIADRIDGIVILEVQPGLADLMGEIRALEKYLSLPQVNLAIDPEFVMVRSGARPGTRVGTVDAADVNAAIDYLSALVRDRGLPPKVLVVHRYTRPMVTNATEIRPTPEVQVVMDMDGWGPPAQKRDSYASYIYPYPVQFTGFKIFYKNDTKSSGSRVWTPAEVLELVPQPSFIQYQ